MRFRYLTKYINKPAPPWTEPVLGRIRKDLSPYHHHWHGSLSDRQSNIALPRKSLRLSLIREQYFDRRRPLAHQHRRRGTVSTAAPPGLAGWLAGSFPCHGKINMNPSGKKRIVVLIVVESTPLALTQNRTEFKPKHHTEPCSSSPSAHLMRLW